MFPLTDTWNGNETAGLCKVICDNLKILQEKIQQYFSPDMEQIWASNPFSSASVVGDDMTLRAQEQFIVLKQDQGLRLSFADLPLDTFWISAAKQIPILTEKAVMTLLLFQQHICVR